MCVGFFLDYIMFMRLCEDVVMICEWDFVVCSVWEVLICYLGLYVFVLYCFVYVCWCVKCYWFVWFVL